MVVELLTEAVVELLTEAVVELLDSDAVSVSVKLLTDAEVSAVSVEVLPEDVPALVDGGAPCWVVELLLPHPASSSATPTAVSPVDLRLINAIATLREYMRAPAFRKSAAFNWRGDCAAGSDHGEPLPRSNGRGWIRLRAPCSLPTPGS